jgi:hypothetical protein
MPLEAVGLTPPPGKIAPLKPLDAIQTSAPFGFSALHLEMRLVGPEQSASASNGAAKCLSLLLRQTSILRPFLNGEQTGLCTAKFVVPEGPSGMFARLIPSSGAGMFGR